MHLLGIDEGANLFLFVKTVFDEWFVYVFVAFFFFFNVFFLDTAWIELQVQEESRPLSLHYVEPGHLATNLLIGYRLALYSLTTLLLRA